MRTKDNFRAILNRGQFCFVFCSRDESNNDSVKNYDVFVRRTYCTNFGIAIYPSAVYLIDKRKRCKYQYRSGRIGLLLLL